MEEWKRYRDSIYEVSNLGNVRNKDTQRLKTQFYKYNGKKENDYVRVSLHIDGKEKNIPVHRMVAECFLEDFSEELEVNHKNSKRWDNRVDNLEMTTKEANYQHSIMYGNGSQRKPVYALDKNGNRHDFISLWKAGRFIKETQKNSLTIDHICNNIKANLRGESDRAYDYEWHWHLEHN